LIRVINGPQPLKDLEKAPRKINPPHNVEVVISFLFLYAPHRNQRSNVTAIHGFSWHRWRHSMVWGFSKNIHYV